jgi:hypothetical protein
LQDAVRVVVRDTGADVVIPGEVPMNLLLATNGISRVDGVPLIDSLACTMKMAELMVDRRRATGITYGRPGWFKAAPERGESSPGWLRSTARTGWASSCRRRGNVGRCSAAKPRLQLG